MEAYSDNLVLSADLPRYDAEPTMQDFHASNAFVRGLRGPIGSGKSSACCIEIINRACNQRLFNGSRKSRWAIIRNTYPELKSTTIKTWQDWFPEPVCKIKWDFPINGHMYITRTDDGSIVELEVFFLALDRPQDVKKLLSLELTGAWINEARELPKEALDMITGRIGRYPSKRLGGFNWTGVIMDTNSPDDDHWWYNLAEIQKPQDYSFFDQPPAMIKYGDTYLPNNGQVPGIAAAENIHNLPMGWSYYEKLTQGKTHEWIAVYVLNQYGTVIDGKPVYPEYNDAIHFRRGLFEIYRGLPMILTFDFGLTPACIMAQITPAGQFRAVDELCADYMGLKQFLDNKVLPYVSIGYPGMEKVVFCDPAGSAKGQTDEKTCIQVLKNAGLPPTPAYTNDLLPRRDAVANYLTKMVAGEPGFLMSEKCKQLRKGFLGGYCYARVKVEGEERFKDVPKKNKYSHPHDALQYGCMMGSGGTIAQRPKAKARQVVPASAAVWS